MEHTVKLSPQLLEVLEMAALSKNRSFPLLITILHLAHGFNKSSRVNYHYGNSRDQNSIDNNLASHIQCH